MTLFDAGDAPSPAASSEPSPRLRLTVAYDGTDFHGWAAQPGQRTVEGVVTDALAQVLQVPPASLGVSCAGRTDTGVHAWGQVVSLDVSPPVDIGRVRRALNRMLSPEVVVRSASRAAPDFDARRSARWRRYRYTVVNRPEPDPFLARYASWVPEPLDLSVLRLAADPFVGTHDFAAFCRRGPEGSTTVRRVFESRWTRGTAPGAVDLLHYEIRAASFCWQMVRALVGTLLEAGLGRRAPGDMLNILRAGDRAAAGNLAPAHGLCLWAVGYE